MAGARVILVDGYNVIRNTPALAQIERTGGLENGCEALLKRLAPVYRNSQHRVVVVFDGARSHESRETLHGFAGGLIIYSRAGESADAVIVRLTAEARGRGEDVTVITNDREIREGAGLHGAESARVGDLQRRMAQPPRHLRKRFAGRIGQQSPAGKDDDDEDDARPRRDKGNPRRAPRNRRRGQGQSPI